MKSPSTLKSQAKEIIKEIKEILQIIMSISCVIVFSKFKKPKMLDSLKELAIVLGNGPSLAQDMKEIELLATRREADIWAVNNFAKSPEYLTIKPRFYVLADPNYWTHSTSPQATASRDSLFDSINTSTEWTLYLYVPFEAQKSAIEEKIKNNKVKIIYYNRTPVSGVRKIRNMIYDSGLGMPPAYNVLIAAIYLTINLGYKEVAIFGADHSWHEELKTDHNNDLIVTQHHFYDKKATPDKIYKEHNIPFRISEIFSRWGLVFLQYEILREYAEKKKSLIYNHSSKSYIDAFDRPPPNKGT